MSSIYWASSDPGNKGFPVSISAKMHPAAHTSIAVVYSVHEVITSGARYHRVVM